MAIDGDLAAAGASGADVTGHANAGSVYIYRRDSDSLWRESAKLIPPKPAESLGFGSSVALNRGDLAVGSARG